MRCVLHYLPSSALTAQSVSARLRLECHEIALHRFPDKELRVTVGPVGDTTILYASLDQPNEKLLALLFAAEAARRLGARRLVLVAPYLCYMRQDAAFHDGEAISQQVIGRLLAATVDRVITIDAHLHRTPTLHGVFPGIESDNLSAMPAIAKALRVSGIDPSAVVIGPDQESRFWVEQLARQLGIAHTVAQKVRHSDQLVKIKFPDPSALAGRPALMVDDIVSSGGTLIACAKALSAAGVSTVDVVVTHALFPPELMDEFRGAGIRSVRSTSSVPHPTNAIALEDTLADALRKEIATEATS